MSTQTPAEHAASIAAAHDEQKEAHVFYVDFKSGDSAARFSYGDIY